MLSYRHAFHAGNFADVVKHATLALIVGHLTGKDKPLFYLDTHAGAGWYRLDSPMAEKTGEWHEGIGRLTAADDPPPALAPYLAAVRGAGEGRYPGSPAIVRAALRPKDRAELYELHPAEHVALRRWMSADGRFHVHRGDGLQALRSRLPPPERRGLILVDPSYERHGEYVAVARAVGDGLARLETGVYAVWFPILHAAPHRLLLDELGLRCRRPALAVEWWREPPGRARGMTGCGLWIANPPWRLETQLREILPWLSATLGRSGAGHRLEALPVGEQA